MKRQQLEKRKIDKQERFHMRPLGISIGFRFSLMLLAASLCLGGCGGEAPAPPPTGKQNVPPASRQKVAPRKPATPVPGNQQATTPGEKGPEYSYNPAGKPDPFKPFIQLTPLKQARAMPLTPLQRYELSQLKLVAIISTREGNMALVEDSAGKGFFLKKGTLIGKSDGKVAKVLKDRVIVEEIYQDVYGRTKSNEAVLYLHRSEEGTQP